MRRWREEAGYADRELEPSASGPTLRLLLTPSGRVRTARRQPDAALVAELNDPACEPLTLVYCLFRYRHNQMVISMLLEKLECHAHPAKLSAFTLHLSPHQTSSTLLEDSAAHSACTDRLKAWGAPVLSLGGRPRPLGLRTGGAGTSASQHRTPPRPPPAPRPPFQLAGTSAG